MSSCKEPDSADQGGEKSQDKIYDNPKGKSEIWKYFGFKKKDGCLVTDRAICRLCLTEYKYTSSSTTVFINHMNSQHKDISLKTGAKRAYSGKSQPSIVESVQKSQQYPHNSAKAQNLDNLVLKYLIKDVKPLSTADSKYFTDMIYGLDPRYKLPSSTFFTGKMVKVYDVKASELKDKLAEQEQMGLTCDFWTSPSCQSYLTVTSHFVDNDWQLHSPVLLTREIEESHTGENIANNLAEAVTEWRIQHGINMTTDNASNMLVAARLLKERGILSQHLPCLGHTINLTAKSGLKEKNIPEISNALARVRSSVKYFRKSPLARSVFNKKQELLDLPKHSPILDVDTRWNSTYDMVVRYIEQEPAIQAALLDPSVTKSSRGILLDQDQALLLQDVIKVLKPFKDATEHLSKEKSPTASIIVPTLTLLRSHLEKRDEGESKVVSKLKDGMLKDIKSRYTDPEVQNFIRVSSALDPRFKHLSFISETEKNDTIEHLQNLLLEQEDRPVQLKTEPVGNMPELPDLGTNPTSSSSKAIPAKRVKTESSLPCEMSQSVKVKSKCSPGSGSFFQDLFITKVEPPKSKIELIIAEIQRYMSDSSEIAPDFELLTWWKDRVKVYPRLSRLARKHLSCPATSVPSERLFSAAGNLLCKRRSCLKPENVDKMLFLNKNW